MTTLVLAALLAVSVAPEFVAGKAIPQVEFTDENGRVRSSDEWRGAPAIIAPLYVRCPLACPMIVRGLKAGIADTTASPASYRVVLLSFDPRDTPEDLRRFRERNKVPLAWTVGVARDARPLLDAIGYRYAQTKTLYTHPNAVVVLTRDLKTAKFLFGTTYEGRAIEEALAIASGRRDWITQLGPWLLALLLMVMLLSMIVMLTP